MPSDPPSLVPKAAPPSTWAPLAVPAFRALWIAGLVSDLGAWMHGVGELDEPLWQALTAEVVPRSALPAAVTLGGVSMNLARSLGPALGGVVVALAGPAAVFGLNALTFLWVIAALARLRRHKGHGNGARRALGGRHGGGDPLHFIASEAWEADET